MPKQTVNPGNIVKSKKIYASGRLDDGKRFEDIIEAFSCFHKIHNDFKLIILGTGPTEADLRLITNTLGLTDSVIFYGLSDDPMRDMLDGYMYLFASDNEGYPNSLAEAMMIGLPCIATDCEFGPSDIIDNGETGFLVRVGDVESMSCAMCKLVDKSQLAKKCLLIQYNTGALTLKI